jgi:hypothetical protein
MMSGKRSIAIVAIGVLLAASVIGGVSILQREGILPGLSPTSETTTSSTTGHPITSSSTSTLSKSRTPQGSGLLILKIHDPPNVPPNVTAVYVTYADISVTSIEGITIGLNQSGTINLMTVVNFTQTIANAKVQAGVFDLITMNISSVIVTWNSNNYTASITNDQLSVPLSNNLQISNLGTVGAVVDVSPTIIERTVFNSSGGQSPSFLVVPSASGYIVPSNQISGTQVGDREDITNQTWLTSQINNDNRQTGFSILSSSLSNSSFVIAVKNTGNRSITIQSVFISSNNSQVQTEEEDHGLNIGSSILFGLLSNGSLVPFGSTETSGYNLSAHAQTVFTYLGQVPPAQSYTGSEGGDNTGTTITRTFTSTAATSTGGDSYVGMDPLESGGSNSYGLKIVAGQSYFVGATSGDATSTLVILAT